MAKKEVKKTKKVETNKEGRTVNGAIESNTDEIQKLTEIVRNQRVEIQKLNARLDRIVAALSTAKPITKNM